MAARSVGFLSNKEDNGTLRQGIVDSIIVRDGVQYAKVGNDEIKLDEIIQVTNPTQAEENETPVQNAADSAETTESKEPEASAQPEDNGNTL